MEVASQSDVATRLLKGRRRRPAVEWVDGRPSARGPSRRSPSPLLAGLALILVSSWPAPSFAQAPLRKIGELELAVRGLSATVEPEKPVVPKNVASAVRVVVRTGARELSAAEAAEFLGADFEVQAELSGPGLTSTLSLPQREPGDPLPADPFLLHFPPLPTAGDYALANLRIVAGGRTVLDVAPSRVTLDVIERVLVTSVKTRALTLDEIVARGIDLSDAENYLGFGFTLGMRLESEAVQFSFPVIFNRDGTVVPEPPKRKDGKPLALGTQAQYLSVVKAFCGFLKRSGRLPEDPARRVSLPVRKRLPRALNKTDACRLMSVPDSRTPFGLRDRAILELLYGTGVRMTECTQLDLGDLDLAQGILMVRSGKNRKDRLLPIPGRARAALEAYLQAGRPELVRPAQEPAAFLSRYGSRLSDVGLRLVVRAHGRSIGLRVSCHVLRHSCATHLLAGGADVREIQRLLGHENLKTTALYTKVDLRALRKMIKACHPRERADHFCPTTIRD